MALKSIVWIDSVISGWTLLIITRFLDRIPTEDIYVSYRGDYRLQVLYICSVTIRPRTRVISLFVSNPSWQKSQLGTWCRRVERVREHLSLWPYWEAIWFLVQYHRMSSKCTRFVISFKLERILTEHIIETKYNGLLRSCCYLTLLVLWALCFLFL